MRMRIARSLTATSLVAAVASIASRAQADQVDTNPPLPNVLILLDNSGSMERMIDGTNPEDNVANQCNCDPTTGVCNYAAQPAPNRFGLVQQAFTGTLTNGYNCAAMPRTAGSVFASEYQIGGAAPYDVGYYLPYHRPIAGDTSTTPTTACVVAPGALPGANTPGGVGPLGTGLVGSLATDFPANAIINRGYGQLTTTSNSCSFSQLANGALDSMRDLMRFGLMTFDEDPGAGLGVTSGPNPAVLNPGAFNGMWSYFPNWNAGGACPYIGNPAACATSTVMAVGSRNPAAPPWEGRMMEFPSTYDLASQESNNDRIQSVIMATRPYGATPLGGMFQDAQYYFWNDPQGPQVADPYVSGGCRNEYIILLTDGAPNLDLRPQCAQTGSPNGKCPFPLPETTAQTLYTATGSLQKVTTYVIGFAVSSFQDAGTTVYCSNLVSSGNLVGACSDPSKAATYGPCCELQRIAIAGGSTQAYFADTPGDLQNALGAILADIAKNTTTRTTPSYSPVVTNVLSSPSTPQTNESLYLASFNPSPGLPWSGDVQRQRYVCTYSGSGYTVPSPTITNSKGDDFAANLNSNIGPARTFIAFQPDPVGGGADASATIRPYVAAGVLDGLGKYSATTYAGAAPSVVSSVTSTALGLNVHSCPYTSSSTGTTSYLTPAQCSTMLLDYTFGQQSFSGPSDFKFVSRYGNAFGDVFHASPTVVGPPGSLLQDASYVGFRGNWSSRKQIVYVATNDGLLHAFWADETQLENNEIWAMLPPAVMPNLNSSYPSSHEFLLDGMPVVKDVVWDRSLGNATDPTLWHTMLVAGYGPYQQGYYAVDVTNPSVATMPNGIVPTDPPPAGPIFRWQLTKMPATNMQLFGGHSATPTITTLFMDPGDGQGAREIGVALLPGGEDTGPTTSLPAGPSCARAAKATDSAPLVGYTARPAVRCWGAHQVTADPVVGRSLSIVRLDNGEILRVFARLADAPATDTLKLAGRISDTPFDSPITGTPMVYPVDVGTNTTKAFVGDADGTVWRINLASSDPSQWTAELFLDLYNKTVDTSATSWGDGQPFEVTPVLSLDPAGELVLNIASGTTEQFDNTGLEYVYSVTEKVLGSPPKFRANVNWWLAPTTFQPGERVSGPMTVFNGTLYFATYSAAPPGAQVCTGGLARLWGRDFVTPDNSSDLSQGGLRELQPPPPNPPLNPPPVYVQPSDYDSTLLGKVIPGVSIKATPACAGLGTPGNDSYVYGASHSAPQNYSSGSFSLFTQVGAKGTGGASTKTIDVAVPTPVSPTQIDSWAAVLE